MIGGDLLKFNIQDKKILAFDSETESLNLKFARPWDISFITYQGYKIVEEKQFYIKWPNIDIPPDLAQRIHYNPKIVEEKGIEPLEAMKLVNLYINDNSYDIITGNNLLNYDCMIFFNACKLCDIDLGYKWLNKVYDCNSIFKGWKRGLKVNQENFLAWQLSQNNFVQRGLKSNVAYICKEFGIEYIEDNLHGSLADTRLSGKIFFELIKKVEIK